MFGDKLVCGGVQFNKTASRGTTNQVVFMFSSRNTGQIEKRCTIIIRRGTNKMCNSIGHGVCRHPKAHFMSINEDH
jgi:hypothetical protein